MTNAPWGPLHREMTAAIDGEPRNVADVVEQLVAIQRVLDRFPTPYGENPVADFNNLYTTIAMRVLRFDREGRFADRTFLDVLHVEFMMRYVDALRGWGAGSTCPSEAWTVLFRHCGAGGTASLPYAAAGANAHLNYDLPLALVAAWDRLGAMDRGSVQHRDYRCLTEIVSHAMAVLSTAYQAVSLQVGDTLPPRFDRSYRWLLLQLTGDLGWDRAWQMWRVCGDPAATEDARRRLDDITALTGCALLFPFEDRTPAGAWL